MRRDSAMSKTKNKSLHVYLKHFIDRPVDPPLTQRFHKHQLMQYKVWPVPASLKN